MAKADRPLGRKNYGSIGHLPSSRLGPGDHHVHEGQARCMTEALPRGDWLVVQEKLDGSNVGVCRIGQELVAIQRAGYRCADSPREMHRVFARWVRANECRFEWLPDRWRVAGEWLGQAHGTEYELLQPGNAYGYVYDPFVAFDVFDAADVRLTHVAFRDVGRAEGLHMPQVFHDASEACPISAIEGMPSCYTRGKKEGAVYRWERAGRVLMLAKWVHPDKIDGHLLDGKPVLNWWPVGQ